MVEALKDTDAAVRCVVVDTMGELMKVAPGLEKQALLHVQRALVDDRADRRAAVAILREMVLAAPDLAAEALPLMLGALRLERGHVQ